MLTLREGGTLIFVELKTGRKAWVPRAVEQLRSTINLFVKNHDIDIYSKKHAYASNRRYSGFPYSMKNEIQKFKHSTGFILKVTPRIQVG